MTEIDPLGILEELATRRSGFDTRPDYPPPTGLVARMLRYFGGNPIKDFNGTSTAVANVQILPDTPAARVCVLQVIAGSIIFTEGGATPAVATSMSFGTGTLITLLGQESIKGFQWASTGAVTANIAGTFYD